MRVSTRALSLSPKDEALLALKTARSDMLKARRALQAAALTYSIRRTAYLVKKEKVGDDV